MADILYRLLKGARLTNEEVDDNFRALNQDLEELYQRSVRSIAELTPSADKMILYTGATTAVLVNSSSFGRGLLAANTAADARLLLGTGEGGGGSFSGSVLPLFGDYAEVRYRATNPENPNMWRIRSSIAGIEPGDLQIQFSDDNFESFTNAVEFNPAFTLFHVPAYCVTPPSADNSLRLANTLYVDRAVVEGRSGPRVHVRRVSAHNTVSAPANALFPIDVPGDFAEGLAWSGAECVPTVAGLYYVGLTVFASSPGAMTFSVCLNGVARASWHNPSASPTPLGNNISAMIYCNGTTDTISTRVSGSGVVTIGAETAVVVALVSR